ncbi:MAG TPA: diguanylate cyclase [Pseudomonas xinjiangensis]|uniref:diguanylate cyclase n=2 Tax=root TaxID=1 RepID=A0A7V1BSX8_9GAMM|nr:diguanylate cyclase [Halopseudomonas xinjiangensis]HEC47263.1 diguanylate cyclase [Halopseudomonas xinjiangensis]
MDKTELLRSQLLVLAESFRQRLETDIPALSDLARSLPATTEAPIEPLRLLRDSLHKLAGSAGTFGYPTLGNKARELEQTARQCLDQRSWDDACRQRLIDGIDELKTMQKAGHSAQGPNPQMAQASVQPSSALRIFILDDDPQSALRVAQTLESFGYVVVTFATAAKLTPALEHDRPDALVLDVSPGTAGHGLLESIQRLQATWNQPLPLIAVSDQESFDIQLSAVRAGAQGFFIKPLDLAALENRLERCFNSFQSEPFRVLVVDDDIDLAQRFEAVLSSADMRVETVSDPRLLLQHMDVFMPDVILMDVNMPDYSGPELAQMIRMNDNWLRVPIVYLSAETDVARQMAALLKAGDDFITKPISDSVLITTVYSRAQRARLVSQALARDSLTGLLKHADIKEQVELEIERARRTKLPVSIAMIDIDHFKQVNDSHGHGVGDNVIRALANLLRQRLRKGDRLGRYGGEEFVAVLPNCNAEDAKTILDDIRAAFNALYFSGSNGAFQCSFSAGVSACQALGWEASGLLERADASLYQAKAQGRNRIVLADSGSDIP